MLVPALALAVLAARTALAGAGDQRTALRGGVSVVLPAGWHVLRGRVSEVVDPIPLAFATFHVHFSRHTCECGTPNVAGFPRTGAFVLVWEYDRVSRQDLRAFPAHAPHFRIGPSVITGQCAPSDSRSFRAHGRGFAVQIYLGPSAPASARAQIAAILDSWRVTAT